MRAALNAFCREPHSGTFPYVGAFSKKSFFSHYGAPDERRLMRAALNAMGINAARPCQVAYSGEKKDFFESAPVALFFPT